jgi:hypothetical protein
MLWIRLTGGSCSAAVARVENPELDEGPSSIRSSVEHAKLDPVFMQICEEDGLTEGGKLVQDAVAQYTAVSKCHECGQSIKTKEKKNKKMPVMVRAIWRCYKREVTLDPRALYTYILFNYSCIPLLGASSVDMHHSTSALRGSPVEVRLVHRDCHGHRLLHPKYPYVHQRQGH